MAFLMYTYNEQKESLLFHAIQNKISHECNAEA